MRSKKPTNDHDRTPIVESQELVPCRCQCIINQLAQVLLDCQHDEQSMLLLQGGPQPHQHLGLLRATHTPDCNNTRESLEAQILWFASEDNLLDYINNPANQDSSGVAIRFETALFSFLENRRLHPPMPPVPGHLPIVTGTEARP